MADTFEEFVTTALGRPPLPFQCRLAEQGLPGLLQAPSGAGKTTGTVLAWLYRRLIGAPERTPRRLVLVLPTGALARPTADRIRDWLVRLELTDRVGLHLLAGATAPEGGWRRHPERTEILVGTQDLLLSRALMRGYADRTRIAAVSFAVLHNDAQWVFDELHLFDPAAVATAVRLQRWRDRLGTAAPTATLWLSSTQDGRGVDGPLLAVDPAAGAEGDWAGAAAVRRIRRLSLAATDPYPTELARAVRAAHRPGTRTLVVVHTPARARALQLALAATADGTAARPAPVLLHPHHRAADRPEPGDLVVATPAVATELELSGRTVVTEPGGWSALVRLAGRCNRYGEHPEGGDLFWCSPPEGGGDPAVRAWLTAREGEAVRADQLFAAPITEDRAPAAEPALAELLELFDTATAEQGRATVDRWTGAVADAAALVAWRDWATEPAAPENAPKAPDAPGTPAGTAAGPAGGPAADEPDPGRAELCPVPLTELAPLLAERGWLRDRSDGHWRRATPADLRPGMIVLLDAAGGGYLPDVGWSPTDRTPVTVAGGPPAPTWAFACTSWVGLDQHLQETAEEAEALLAALGEPIGAELREAVVRAARYHDLGKCHEVFQRRVHAGGGEPPAGLLAKSKAPFNTGVSERPYFRHELVSALMLLADGTDFLVTYLAAAHHGKVRLAARPGPDEAPRLLGVEDGDRTPEVVLSTGERFAPQVLRTDAFRPDGQWTARATALRDRADLGPFRLAYLESLVRLADWRSSGRHDGPVPSGPA
ncbi:CRISPR-associated endonuclease Cas3'' [Kitasatospora sp. LaBMicrA B282]|uniref:CRISPR-associated endonuclease Cas3'' n=1 Tax=Kitasatospora sp. LaBMicrA B282 TaxID=3420949 RepID=UPI003D0DF09B